MPNLFLDPGGQAGSNGTPDLGIGPRGTEPQGPGWDSCSKIYKDKLFFWALIIAQNFILLIDTVDICEQWQILTKQMTQNYRHFS